MLRRFLVKSAGFFLKFSLFFSQERKKSRRIGLTERDGIDYNKQCVIGSGKDFTLWGAIAGVNNSLNKPGGGIHGSYLSAQEASA